MKALLLFENQDFDLEQKLAWNEQVLTQDLELNTLFNAMALSDEFLFEVANKIVFAGLNNDLETILYRQNILKDCLKNSSVIKTIYSLVVEAIEREKKHWFWMSSKHPSYILSGSIDKLQIFMDAAKQLENIANQYADNFESKGFIRFFTMLKEELNDTYFIEVQNHLKELKFKDATLVSAELGKGNKGTHYTLHKLPNEKQSWLQQLFTKQPDVYTFYIDSRDEAGVTALSELNNKAINLVANAIAQAADHILDFFNMLRTELAFYVGCLNLHEQLLQWEAPISFPRPMNFVERRHFSKGLYDVCLSLTKEQKIVGTNLNADEKNIVFITGANKGGKSTFLRSIGLSQLMMQCGMYVPAESFCANVCDSLFTHYRKEEDITMKSGKLDEELSRMSEIVDHITTNSLLLFNESFTATNGREGSEIAGQIVSAFLEKHIKVFFVTHLYELSYGFYNKKMKNVLFLRAERKIDGRRTFKLIEGEPFQTSYGEDLYNKIFREEKV